MALQRVLLRGIPLLKIAMLAAEDHRFPEYWRAAASEVVIDGEEDGRDENVLDMCLSHHPIGRLKPFGPSDCVRCWNGFALVVQDPHVIRHEPPGSRTRSERLKVSCPSVGPGALRRPVRHG